MKNMRLAVSGLLLLLATFSSLYVSAHKGSVHPVWTHYVDPKIGTGGHGHVFYGVNVPFGMVQLGPTSIPQQWDWTSGHHASDSTVIGFSHTHLSGTGIGNLFDITLMPVVGDVVYARGNEAEPKSGLWSYSDQNLEVCRPGYYATRLSRYNIEVELTCTKRVGFHKYAFPETQAGAVVFDLQNGGCWDAPVAASVRRLDAHTLAGFRYSKGWADRQRIYFVAEFSQPVTSLEVMADGKSVADAGEGRVVYARARLAVKKNQPVYVKVALSPTSIENARLNLLAELPGWNFEQTVEKAGEAWNRALSKIAVENQDEEVKRIFYTALYHTMVAPSEFCDVNGDYYGADHQNHKGSGFINHTTLSCWDTYRAAHPLMSLIHPERMPDMMQTFLQIYKEQGKLPVWHLMGCETNCMVGSSGACILADGVLKGYVKDETAAYEALRQTLLLDERGMGFRKKWGYIPCDKMKESVAYNLEYAIADAAVAAVAKRLGKTEDEEYFRHRSHSYRHLIDPATGLVRGKDSLGHFRKTFNPLASNHRNDDYCEGNAWQYTFLVPHDVLGLAGCLGGRQHLLTKLDSLFTVDSQLVGEESSPDISGMIGQYAHGNEPGHHTIYLYTLLGEPAKTAGRVRRVMTELYSSGVDGLCGNEDVGEMSAWYVLSALGFYQVNPADSRYVFGCPMLDRAVLKVRDGQFAIQVLHRSPQNKYIQSVKLNGHPYPCAWIDFEDIARGGELVFEMGAQPKCWYPITDLPK